jgi:ubiquinone/menaquinone biosynthesis C-methylase UbiE
MKPSTPKADFGPLAARYDELREANELWAESVDVLVREGDLRGRRVLDVGCGTGRLAAVLAERYGCKVWGVDRSPEMLEVARGRVPAGVGLKVGEAEDLPFRDGWFERATMTLVFHHLDPDQAVPELWRVLVPGGCLAFLTMNPAFFPGYYLNRYFPSFLEIDRARFRPPEELESMLVAGGFASVRIVSHHQVRTLDRELALTKIRGRHISTFQLISDEEYEAGLARAERELPEEIAYEYNWLIVVAERGQ